MKNILKNIKDNSYAPVYLLYGDENYLLRTYKNKLKEAIAGDNDMNYSYFEGKDVNIPAIIDIASTMPFLADKRLIIIENSGLFKTATDEAVKLVTDIPDECVIIYVEREVDKRNKLFKKVKESGYICEMTQQNNEVLSRWILDSITREGRKITGNTMNYFLSITGNDMENITNELEKVLSYTIGKDVITAQDIDAVCTAQTVNRIFDMITAMALKQRQQAIKLYNDLLTLKEPPMRILFLTSRQFANLLAVKEMTNLGTDNVTIASRLGIQGFLVNKYKNQARSFTAQTLKEAVESCIEAESDVKTGRIEDHLAVEMIILKYSR